MRNYKKENERSKELYERIEAKIDKKVGKELKRLVKQDGISLATWITESALVYIRVKNKKFIESSK